MLVNLEIGCTHDTTSIQCTGIVKHTPCICSLPWSFWFPFNARLQMKISYMYLKWVVKLIFICINYYHL